MELPTFLARFDIWTEYCDWDKEDQLFQLEQSLIGPAGKILKNEKDKRAPVGQIKDLLKYQFHHQHQEKWFIVELRSCQRKPGDSQQSLYDNLQKLMALAYLSAIASENY